MVYPEPCQASEGGAFCFFQPLRIFTKSSILDVSKGSEYIFALDLLTVKCSALTFTCLKSTIETLE